MRGGPKVGSWGGGSQWDSQWGVSWGGSHGGVPMGGAQSGVLNGGPNGGGGFSTLPPPSYLHGDLIAAPGVQMGGGLRWGGAG